MDANNDGFVDAPFNVYNGTVYDYLPYSQVYTGNFTFTAGNTQSLTANQTSTQITVKFGDAFGALTTGTTVSLSSSSSSGKFSQ